MASPRVLLSLRFKQRLVIGLLLAMVLWLPVHRWLVVRWEVNPWKLAGWAMYVKPQPRVQVEFLDAAGDRLAPLALDQSAEPYRSAVGEFLAKRKHAGNLVRPDALADVVFTFEPRVRQLAIVVTHTVLDPETATLVPKRFGYRYQRPSRNQA